MFWRDALDFLWPPQCPLCAQGVAAMGDVCCAALPPGDPLPPGEGISAETRRAADAVICGLQLTDSVKQLVHAYKYQGLASAGEALAVSAARAAERHLRRRFPGGLPAGAVLVPVPTHPVRVRERGWDHTWELARSLAWKLRRPVVCALRRAVWTPSLTKLRESERREVMAGAIALSRGAGRLRGRVVVLIDDVVTTGVTLETCAETLRRVRPAAVLAVAAAHTPRATPRSPTRPPRSESRRSCVSERGSPGEVRSAQ